MRIVDYLFGKITFSCPNKSHHTEVFDLLRYSGANYYSISMEEPALVFSCPRQDAKHLKKILDKKQITYTVQKEQGLHLFFQRIKMRPGLYLGLVLFLSVLILSTQFVFDIRISGNERLTDSEVLAELEQQGFFCGTFLPGTDIDVLCNRLLLHSRDISWISVNMMGTVAYVQVKEHKQKITVETEDGLSCLVAERDGVILGFDCTTGTIAVNVGETVKKGQVLVNGVTDTALGTYYGNANGAVRAQTNRVFTATIPKNETIVTKHQRTTIEKSIIFLGKTIKLFTKGGNFTSSCDTIQSETKRLYLHPQLLLPFYLKTTYVETPIEQTVSHLEDEARRLAGEEIARQMDVLSQFRILTSQSEWTESEDAYTLTLRVTCIENIAVKIKIQTN